MVTEPPWETSIPLEGKTHFLFPLDVHEEKRAEPLKVPSLQVRSSAFEGDSHSSLTEDLYFFTDPPCATNSFPIEHDRRFVFSLLQLKYE